MIIKILIAVIIGYLIGSINTSILVGKMYGVDIRSKGSGNAGATNTLRVLGKLPGLFVFLMDLLKGVLACFIAGLIMPSSIPFAGLAVILGHNFPVFFNFKGGKGIATSFGFLLYFDYRIAVTVGVLAILLIIITRIVSLSVLTAFTVLPFVTYFVNGGDHYINVYITLILTFLSYYTHRQNIRRLLNHEENRFGKSK